MMDLQAPPARQENPVLAAAGPSRPRRRLLLVVVAMLLVSTVPYGVAHERTPAGTTYTGLLLKPFDQYYYLAAERSAAENLERANRFTAEEDAAGPIAPLYRALGELAGHFELPLVAAYHLPRILAGLALPLLLWVLYAWCLPRRRDLAWIALVFALLAVPFRGGENIPEATIFFSVVAIPHFAVAIAGLAAAMIAILAAWTRRRARAVLGAGLGGGLLVGTSHTFLLLPIALVLFALAATVAGRALRRRENTTRLRMLLVAGGAILLPAAPFLLQLRQEMARFERQQGSPFPFTPGFPADWLTVYGAVMPLFLLGLLAVWRNRRTWITADHALPVILLWIVVQGTLVVSAVTPFQRRFIEGMIVPVAVVSALGADLLLQRLRSIRRQTLVIGTALILLGAVTAMVQSATSATYLEGHYRQAFDHITEDEVVLAGDTLAEQIPAFSDGTVYVGRYVETLHYHQKLAFRSAVTEAADARQLAARLQREGITLLIADETDGTFPLKIDGLDESCFPRLFSAGPVTAVRVAACATP